MFNITYTIKTEINEDYLRQACLDTISDYMNDTYIEYGCSFGELPSDVRRLVYAKVGAALIDYARKDGEIQ